MAGSLDALTATPPNRSWAARRAAQLLLGAALVLVPAIPAGAVHAVSTVGQATAYLSGDFSRSFDVAYRVDVDPEPRNRSWIILNLMLIGTAVPGPALQAGLFAKGNATESYTMSPGAMRRQPIDCTAGCTIELRGDAQQVVALIDGTRQAVWERAAIRLMKPSIQINAQLQRPGDVLDARFHPLVVRAGSRRISPLCAFTTQGVEPALLPQGSIHFSGPYDPTARVTFVDLRTGGAASHCVHL